MPFKDALINGKDDDNSSMKMATKTKEWKREREENHCPNCFDLILNIDIQIKRGKR